MSFEVFLILNIQLILSKNPLKKYQKDNNLWIHQ